MYRPPPLPVTKVCIIICHLWVRILQPIIFLYRQHRRICPGMRSGNLTHQDFTLPRTFAATAVGDYSTGLLSLFAQWAHSSLHASSTVSGYAGGGNFQEMPRLTVFTTETMRQWKIYRILIAEPVLQWNLMKMTVLHRHFHRK